MPADEDYPDAGESEWPLDDPEGPQEHDLIDEDEDETPTVPCPHCHRPVPDFADRCHHCGHWIVQTAGPSARHNLWFVAVVIAVIAAFLIWLLR